MRFVFMGTPAFAVPALDALLAAGHAALCVYTQPPRPAGRGQREQRSPVHEFAAARGLPVRTPARLKEPAEQAAFAALGADVAVVAAYGLILPRPVLDAPQLGCINIHASLLPRWRGAAPIQRALLAGDERTGITIMRMDVGLDTGPMLLQESLPIGPDDTAQTLHDRLAALGARLIVAALERLAAGTLAATPQPADGATYAPKLDRAEARIDWRRPAREIERQLRAFDPWPGAWFEHRGERIKALSGVAAGAAAGAGPGTVIGPGLTVACGDGSALRLTRVQRAGRAAMSDEELLRGYALAPGERLG